MREAIIKVRVVDRFQANLIHAKICGKNDPRESCALQSIVPHLNEKLVFFFFPFFFPKLKKCCSNSSISTILKNPPSSGTIFLTQRLEKARIDRYIYKRILLELIAVKQRKQTREKNDLWPKLNEYKSRLPVIDSRFE